LERKRLACNERSEQNFLYLKVENETMAFAPQKKATHGKRDACAPVIGQFYSKIFLVYILFIFNYF